MNETKITLPESELPRRWYNVAADMPNPAQPPLHPGTGQPIGPDDLAPLFPMALIQQEVSTERFVEIPEEILDIYRLWRPTPLYRAHRLERELGTRSRIFYKYEGVEPGRQPQAEHGRGAGLLQPRGGPEAPLDGDRRRPVGQRARLRVLAVRARVQGLHGQGLVRAEAVPALADARLGRRGGGLAVGGDRVGAEDPRRASRLARAASGSRSRRPSRTPPRARTRRTRSGPC